MNLLKYNTLNISVLYNTEQLMRISFFLGGCHPPKKKNSQELLGVMVYHTSPERAFKLVCASGADSKDIALVPGIP